MTLKTIEEVVAELIKEFYLMTTHDVWTPKGFFEQRVKDELTARDEYWKQQVQEVVEEILNLAPRVENIRTGEIIYDAGVDEYVARISTLKSKRLEDKKDGV